MTRGEKVIRFIEGYLCTPEGDHVGKPVVLEQFQKDFILAVYDNPHGTRKAILSMARKNGKTGLIAFIVIAHLVGPEAIQNSRMVSGALSKDQAAQVFNLAAKCVRISPKLGGLVHIVPAGKVLVGKLMNTEYRAVSAEAKTAHGLSPVVAILDEMGQIRGPQSDFVDAIVTSQSAYSAPLLFIISTQAATDADYLSIQIDHALTKKPPNTVCHVHAAPADCDVLDQKGWYAANPALGKFRDLEEMAVNAQSASEMPSFENTFRNLYMNQRVSTFSPFISANLWKQALKPGCVIPPNTVCCAGLDLSKRTDLTAFSLAAWVGGQVVTETYFWAPEIGLKEREKLDRVDYTSWAKAGYLKLTPGATVDYDFIIEEILAIVGDRVLEKVAFDPWRFDVLEKALERAGISLPLVKFSQGFKNMSPAVEAVEALLLNGTLKHPGCPVQTMCAANATTSKNPTGERMLDKAKSTGRIDGIVAMTMAIGSMNMDAPEEATDLGDWADAFGDPIIL